MNAFDTLLPLIVGAATFYLWGDWYFRFDKRSRGYTISILLVYGIPAAVIGFARWRIVPELDNQQIAFIFRLIRFLCAFYLGGYAGMVILAVRRLFAVDD